MSGMKKTKVEDADFRIFDERAARGLAVAAAIDQGKPIPYSVTIKAHKFSDFLTALTPKRFELLKLSKGGKLSNAELAVAARRDPSAVSKDVAKLVDLGLVKATVASNTGHGVKKVVQPAAENIEIHATVL